MSDAFQTHIHPESPEHMRWPDIPAIHVYVWGEDDVPTPEQVYASVIERARKYTIRYFRVESIQAAVASTAAAATPIFPHTTLFTKGTPAGILAHFRARIVGEPFIHLKRFLYTGKVGERWQLQV